MKMIVVLKEGFLLNKQMEMTCTWPFNQIPRVGDTFVKGCLEHLIGWHGLSKNEIIGCCHAKHRKKLVKAYNKMISSGEGHARAMETLMEPFFTEGVTVTGVSWCGKGEDFHMRVELADNNMSDVRLENIESIIAGEIDKLKTLIVEQGIDLKIEVNELHDRIIDKVNTNVWQSICVVLCCCLVGRIIYGLFF